MGWLKRRWGSTLLVAVAAVSLGSFAVVGCGCQNGPALSGRALMAHQATIDPAGLAPVRNVNAVKAHVAPPAGWHRLPLHKGMLYTHQQWRSPSRRTGVGVAHIRLPLPFSAKTVIWFAKGEYSKQRKDGKLLGQWTDALGRPWFEGENAKYHIRGYVVTDGFDAWIIYSGYRVQSPPLERELEIARRSLETILPKALIAKPKGTVTASVE